MNSNNKRATTYCHFLTRQKRIPLLKETFSHKKQPVIVINSNFGNVGYVFILYYELLQ